MEKIQAEDAGLLPVFVYGTLRPGEKNFTRFFQGRTLRIRSATVGGELFFVEEGGYPYLTPGEGRVVGELVEIDPLVYRRTLESLDRLEEYDPENEGISVYLRRSVRVTLAGGEEVAAWVYFWNQPQIEGRRIESGDFRDRVLER